MNTSRFGAPLAAVGIAVGVALLSLPGCIVGEIRDELKSANSQLGDVQQSLGKLDQTNEQIARTNEELIRTSKLIDEVQQGLGRIDTTNSSLNQVDQQLAILNSINTSLNHLDAHLASLRKTISSLDDSIPFFSFGDSADEAAAIPAPDAAPTAPAGEPAPAPAPPEPAATEVAAAPAAAPADQSPARDPMVGAWVTRYPDDTRAIIFAPDGRFILSRRMPDGTATEFLGEWKRDQRSLKLTGLPIAASQSIPAAAPTQPPAPAPAAAAPKPPTAAPSTPATPGEPAAAPVDPQPITRVVELVIITGRSVTIRLDGELIILVRP
ncbi:MAG: hypothetical protein IT436_10430 [Phycisphaerales bacterium]|nr:hypothetical protein [Phycisphaerales bacterium]